MILMLSAVGSFSALFLIGFALQRFTTRKYKVSRGLNVSGALLITCSIGCIAILKSEIDTGFLTSCILLVTLSVVLIILNHSFAITQNNKR